MHRCLLLRSLELLFIVRIVEESNRQVLLIPLISILIFEVGSVKQASVDDRPLLQLSGEVVVDSLLEHASASPKDLASNPGVLPLSPVGGALEEAAVLVGIVGSPWRLGRTAGLADHR